MVAHGHRPRRQLFGRGTVFVHVPPRRHGESGRHDQAIGHLDIGIALARQFELHMKMMQNTETGERDAARLLSVQS